MYYLAQYRTTTLSKAGGLNNSDTTGIVLATIPTDVDTDVPGILCLTFTNPLVTDDAEFITYTSINPATKELQGVTRGQEGYGAQTHDNGATIAWVVSKSHINNINDKLTGVDANGVQLTEINDTNGNEEIKFVATSSAVNEISLTNSATGNAPSISATGDDTNISLNLVPKGSGTAQVGGIEIATASSTTTLTNKRITKRTDTVASSATPTINTDTTDIFTITALATDITSMTTNLSGTPTLGQSLIIRILDNGTARAITWGASFASRGGTLPTTTTVSKYTYVGLIWNTVTSTWDCVAVTTES